MAQAHDWPLNLATDTIWCGRRVQKPKPKRLVVWLSQGLLVYALLAPKLGVHRSSTYMYLGHLQQCRRGNVGRNNSCDVSNSKAHSH